jgi:hypothetical protein
MLVRNSVFIVTLLVGLPSVVQGQGERVAVVDGWASASDDPAELEALLGQTLRIGGPEVLRAVMDAAVDERRSTPIRLHALAALLSYVEPGHGWRPFEILLDTTDAVFGRISHPDYTTASSIEPMLRDSVRAVVKSLESDRDPDIRLAAQNLSQVIGPTVRERLERLHCEIPGPGADLEAWYRSAFVPLRFCVEVITDQWVTPGLDSLQLTALFRGAQHLRDRRIPPALNDVASDASRSVEVRWAALQVLATLGHPRMYAVSLRSLQEFDPDWCIHWGWHAHHAVQEEGVLPLGPEGRELVLEYLQEQATGNRSEQLRSGALELVRCVKQLSREHPTPRR